MTAASTATTLASSANPSVVNQAVTYTATVTVSTPGSGTVATGTVTFYDGATAICTGVAVNGSGHANCAIGANTYSSPSTHPITATYNGSTNFLASGASPTLNQLVNPIPTTTAVTFFERQSFDGQPGRHLHRHRQLRLGYSDDRQYRVLRRRVSHLRWRRRQRLRPGHLHDCDGNLFLTRRPLHHRPVPRLTKLRRVGRVADSDPKRRQPNDHHGRIELPTPRLSARPSPIRPPSIRVRPIRRPAMSSSLTA